MSLSSPFIHRPVATALLTVAIGLAGAVAFTLLPVSPLPQVDFPTVSVNASLPGASPEIMASSVATPLERQFGRIAAVTEMTSSSSLGQTSVTLQFDLSRNIDSAARDVEAAINAARGYLPANLPSNPTYRKVNPADAPIMILALTSLKLQPPQLYDAASTILMQRISQIRGVGQVMVGGSSAPAVRVDLNPTQVNHYGLSLESVRTAIAAQTANQAKGSFSDRIHNWMITANDQALHAVDYRPILLKYQNGAAVRLSDVARVTDSVQTVRSLGLANGDHAALLIIFRQPGANIINTVDAIRAALPQLNAAIDPSIKLTVTLDQTITIRASVHDVERSLMISVALVIMVVFLFLREVRATLIPTVAVPVSIIGTCGVMYIFGFSIDNLSLMALTISSGFVVDDAIVVLENITRLRERGLNRMEAALRGAAEIGPTVLSISISLVAVFIPILLMSGVVGRLFRQFAITLSVTIVLSMIISLTATPTMCARLLKESEDHGWLYRKTEGFFEFILGIYEHALRWVLQNSGLVLLIAIATLAFNIYLFIIVPKGFFPQQDTGRLNGNFIGDQSISFQAMQGKITRLSKMAQEDPDVETIQAFSGGGGGTTMNTGRCFITLKPWGKTRHTTADQIITRLRPKLNSIPGITLFLQSAQDLRVGGHQTAAQYQYSLQSDKLEDLMKWAPVLTNIMKRMPQLTDVVSDQQNSGLEAGLEIDRPTASRLGITPQAIDNVLYDGFGEREVARTFSPMNQYYVVMEVDPKFWQTPDGLNQVFVPSATGAAVPLAAFASRRPSTAALTVNHSGVFPSVTISFNLAPGVALGDAVTAIHERGANAGFPTTINTFFTGTAQAFQASLDSQPILIASALAAVYIVLGILYESLIHPITILSTLPSAGVGAILALLITKNDLSVIAMIGIILLIGLVKKNAIMMIDFALAAERIDHLPPAEAVFQACLLRFRPIMMTTMAALLGGLPLALGTGTGAELRRPLGITIVGGLIVSQALTLFTTPVIYLYMDRFARFLQRLRGGVSHGPAPLPSPAAGD
jgi:multidrug efflux pump